MLVDAHHHFWNLAPLAYPTVHEDAPALGGVFGPPDLAPLLAESGVDLTVVVQAVSSLAETRLLLEVAAVTPFVAGVVGWLPLRKPDELAAFLATLPRPSLLKGVRHPIDQDGEPPWERDDRVLGSLGILSARRLALDVAATSPAHLARIGSIASRFPDLVVIVDHLGKPPSVGPERDAWAEALTAVAGHRNVCAKLSGLRTTRRPLRPILGSIRPSLEHALTCFGAERLMVGSDWPISLVARPYGSTMADLVGLIEELCPADYDAILSETAIRTYDLQSVDVSPPAATDGAAHG
jgi:L-fuconolactonase